MCGIVSYFSNEKTTSPRMDDLMHNLLWIDSIRGDHSTGIIYQTPDGVEYYKKAIPGWDFVQLEYVQTVLNKLHTTPYFIGHNRAATRGDVKSSNAHPFQFDHITGVHNGTLAHGYGNLTPVGANHSVDSQHLYHAMSLDGWADLIPKLDGSFNLLWHDDRDNTIHMCRNKTRPYTFAKIKGKETLIGASEKPMLKWLINKHGFEIEYCWTPEVDTEYSWKVGEDMVKPLIVKHKGYVKPPVVVHQSVGTTQNTPQYGHNMAGSQSTVTPSSPLQLIEFFIDNLVANQHLINGQRTYTAYGETVEGQEVIGYVVQEDELERDTWYMARAYWQRATVGVDYWKLDMSTVKQHPLEEGDESLNVCINCGEDHLESAGVFVDNAPVCLSCCQQLSVECHEVDGDEGWKLIQLVH